MVPRVDQHDQATGLRRLLGVERSSLRSVAFFGADAGLTAAACASLAFALAQRGGSVCVIDELPGPHNVAGQLGVSPRAGLAEVLRGAIGLNDAMAAAGAGVRLLSAERGMPMAARTDERFWIDLAEDFADTAWEWLLLPAPADGHAGFALTAARRILVLPANRKHLTAAYALLKGVQQQQPDGAWQVLIMGAGSAEQAGQLASALSDTARRFLGIELGLLGSVPRDAKLDQAARAMRPLLEVAPDAPAAAAFRGLADTMAAWPLLATGMDARVFWQRLGLFSRMNGQPPRPQHWQARHGRVYG